MQYKISKKIIIDEQKLNVLIRLGCPDDRIISLLKTNSFEKTGDSLIDDTLECLIDRKEFNNWGGKRDGSGRHKINHLENQDDNQLENQDGNQDLFQVVDKDIDKDSSKDKDKMERVVKGKPTIQEVIDYCKERNNYVDPQEWFDYYSANGWKVGKNPMKDWKACVRYWERKKQPTQTKSKAQLIEEHNLKHIEELFKEDNLC